MTAPKHTADRDAVVELLERWIAQRTDESGLQWLEDTRSSMKAGAPEWKFFAAFSAVPRHIGKAGLDLTEEDLRRANEARYGWDPSKWSVDQAGRTLIVLSHTPDDPDALLDALDNIFSTADVGEAVALYQSLPVLPFPERLTGRAAEGVRSNMAPVFNAVALDSPYPSEYLDDAAWNQMVLKALFIGSPLHRIAGLDERANPELASMLVDYARERRAASRPVPPELWRPVGPFVDDSLANDVAAGLRSDRPGEREAAALALYSAPSESARQRLDDEPALKKRIESGDLQWNSLTRLED